MSPLITFPNASSLIPRSYLKMMLLGSLPLLFFSSAVAQTVVEPGTEVAGRAIGEWILPFAIWSASEPEGTNVMLDETGEFQHLNQQGPVWFLPMDWFSDPSHSSQDISIRVPSDRYLFVPVSFANSCGTTADGGLADRARNLADTTPWELFFSIDNLNVSDSELKSEFQVSSGVYHWEVPGPSILSENDASGYCAVDGFFVMLEPLPVGEHFIGKGAVGATDWGFHVTSVLAGDLDGDGVLSAADIDSLTDAIAENPSDVYADVNVDGQVDSDDHSYWVESISNFSYGDADLDGQINFSDFLVLSTNFGKPGGWMQGDFDGSRDIAFPDFLLLSGNFGDLSQAAGSHSVPEPNATNLTLMCLFALVRRSTRLSNG